MSVVIPPLQTLVTRGTRDGLELFSITLVFPLQTLVLLCHMGVQSLFVLGGVVTSIIWTLVEHVLTLAMLFVVMLIEKMLVAVSFTTNIAHMLLGDVIFHVDEELLG